MNLRYQVLRALYRLPAPWQISIKVIKRAIFGDPDWAAPIKRLRLREQDYLEETSSRNASLPDRKRIAIYSLHHFSPIEYGLAMALRLRGHHVRGILCDGLLPLCEKSLGGNLRPPCKACSMFYSRYEDAFGFNYARLTDYLDEDDLTRADQLVRQTPPDRLLALDLDGVPVGRFAQRELQRYYRGYVFDPPGHPAFRHWLVAGILMTWLSERWLDSHPSDIVGVCSGRTMSTAPFFTIARSRGIPVVTWDGSATHPDGLTFSHNESATEIPLNEAWRETSHQPLSEVQLRDLQTYLRRWARSEITPFPYNLNPIEDEQAIRDKLSLRGNRPIIAAFTNTAWDIAVIDRDVGFENMFDWVFALVEYAAVHAEIDLIVRSHPAEKMVTPDLRSRTPVADEIRKRYSPLPSNIKLIEGDNPISSYTLAKIAHVNIVYATRFGLELALRGQRAWIAGDVTYRGKGFTLDLTSKEHMLRLFEAKTFDNRLSEEEVTLAQRFAYLWLFRYVTRLPLLRRPDKRFTLESFRMLGPGGDPTVDRLCTAIVTGQPFIDINSY
jgi:hypothetical protein